MAESQNQLAGGSEDVNTKLAEYERTVTANKEKINSLEKDLQSKDNEISDLKKMLAQMEGDVNQAQKIKANRLKEAEEVDSLKSKSEETLTKAKSIIFEKMKVIKNQELQIEALTQQTESLKDVVRITKDLLEIRNLEVKHLEGRMETMDSKIKGEKERQDLIHKKLETMIRHNGELKREYEAQLILFKSLKERYHERDVAQDKVKELLEKNKEDANSTDGAGTSNSQPDEAKPSQPDEATPSQLDEAKPSLPEEAKPDEQPK